MATFLFDKIIFGPVWSRRLGESLGINLLPVNRKVCNFNCLYCECGLTPENTAHEKFPESKMVCALLHDKLTEMKTRGAYIDSITFAGNGEPTMHPEFSKIIDETIACRNQIYPKTNITVLSNATLIGEKEIFEALQKVDLNILKLDSVFRETQELINCPKGNYSIDRIIELMKQFNGRVIIQTLFFRGNRNGIAIDNTTEKEISAWLSVLREVKPESVMIYSLARETAVEGLTGVSAEELNVIAEQLEKAGIVSQVTP